MLTLSRVPVEEGFSMFDVFILEIVDTSIPILAPVDSSVYISPTYCVRSDLKPDICLLGDARSSSGIIR